MTEHGSSSKRASPPLLDIVQGQFVFLSVQEYTRTMPFQCSHSDLFSMPQNRPNFRIPLQTGTKICAAAAWSQQSVHNHR